MALTVNGHAYEAVLDCGPARHELYQRRVFITDQYNLLRLEPGLDPTLVLPAAI